MLPATEWSRRYPTASVTDAEADAFTAKAQELMARRAAAVPPVGAAAGKG